MKKKNSKIISTAFILMLLYFIYSAIVSIAQRSLAGPSWGCQNIVSRKDYTQCCSGWGNCRGPYTGNFPKPFRPATQYENILLQVNRNSLGIFLPGFLYLAAALGLLFFRNKDFIFVASSIQLFSAVFYLFRGFLSFEDFVISIFFLILFLGESFVQKKARAGAV